MRSPPELAPVSPSDDLRAVDVGTTMRTMGTQTVEWSLPDISGSPVTVQLRIRRETVEVWCRDRPVAILDRDQLAAWLAHPDGALICDEMSWMWSHMASVVCIYIRDAVPAYPLSQHVVDGLLQRLVGDDYDRSP